jgi:uncharacterized small protein (TIGR04563 family)
MDRQSRKTEYRIKQSLYVPQPVLDVLNAEGHRLDRSLSWLIQRCVRHGLPSIRALPTVHEPDPERAGRAEHLERASEAAQ